METSTQRTTDMNDKFAPASRSFYSALLDFLREGKYSAPTWAEWLDIHGMARGYKTVPIAAIKLLRETCYREETVKRTIPDRMPQCAFRVFTEARSLRTRREYLPLGDAKAVFDLLLESEEFFSEP